ncbi:phosphoribosyltransferase family protein [Marinoscillum sp. MHG1-6]|uniref:phosphoribosyltransferase family protein n=1 Tax=Marinoscillum sp. MHG1-6 TaxID=2959627 RepID=UPI002157A73D|nr:phosphoribosyltransferase family protein [Marinoscillum sp. MHG1-6]
MISTDNLIIPEKTVRQIIKRFAYEIFENNFAEKEIVLVGVYDKGYQMASLIQDQLKEISDFSKIALVKLSVNKENPLSSEIQLDQPIDELSGKSVVLIDDVLNSGRTLVHCLKALMETDVKKIETVVLVDRSHKRFPVLANYKGYELSTTLDEHVEVKLDSDFGVYLY